MKFLLTAYALFGMRVFNAFLKMVMVYYYWTGHRARKASKAYLIQLRVFADETGQKLPEGLSAYQHFLSFGRSMLEKLAAWRGDWSMESVTTHGYESYQPYLEKKQGVVVLGAHLGNLEVFRALSTQCPELKINALVFSENAERFNAVMKAVNPEAEINLIQVKTLGPEVAIGLKQKLDAGEWVVIMADRTSITKESRVVKARFLGREAPFPQGPFILAAALDVPVLLCFGLRGGTVNNPRFELHIEQFSPSLKLERKGRMEALAEVVQAYADRLDYFVMKAPLQWYNFFNFWELSNGNEDE